MSFEKFWRELLARRPLMEVNWKSACENAYEAGIADSQKASDGDLDNAWEAGFREGYDQARSDDVAAWSS